MTRHGAHERSLARQAPRIRPPGIAIVAPVEADPFAAVDRKRRCARRPARCLRGRKSGIGFGTASLLLIRSGAHFWGPTISREGRAGTRTIKMHINPSRKNVGTVSSVRDDRSGSRSGSSGQPPGGTGRCRRATTPSTRPASRVHLDRLPRMADLAIWGPLANPRYARRHVCRAYKGQSQNRDRGCHRGRSGGGLRARTYGRARRLGRGAPPALLGGDCSRDGSSTDRTSWPKNLRALAGRLRRAQTFLRFLDIEVAFSREGRAGARMIRIDRAACRLQEH